MDPRESPYGLFATKDGNLLQSGVYSRPANAYHEPNNTQGWITRAVVLQVYYPEDDDLSGWTSGGLQRAITCDVRTYGAYSRELTRIPVLQLNHGLWDQNVYIPRAARVNITGGDFVPRPSKTKGPTAAEDLDGDHVLIAFLDNHPDQAVILPYSLPHPKSNYSPTKADGRVRRIRHNGALIEFDKDGNLGIDATGAAKPDLKKDGSEDSNSGTGGQITISTTDGSNKTSIHLNEQGQLLLGSDPTSAADEPLVLGNLWIQVMDQLILQIAAIATACEQLTVGTGVGPSSVPINKDAFTAAKAALTGTIQVAIDAKTHVSDFIFAKKSY